MRELVARFGLKTRCEVCGHQVRHRPESDGRLADRPCTECGSRLRAEEWWKRKARREGWTLAPFTA